MTEHPILYSKQMILAKLAGRKTVTRRPVKPQPEGVENTEVPLPYLNGPDRLANEVIKCPYGTPGDRLWTRENFRITSYCNYAEARRMLYVKYPTEDEKRFVQITPEEWQKWQLWKHPYRNRSKLHMFRSLSRFLDEVIEIYVQRIKEINRAEALNEGIYYHHGFNGYVAGKQGYCLSNHPVKSFFLLWDDMYAETEFALENNPWIWAIRYKPLAVNEAENQNFKRKTTINV